MEPNERHYLSSTAIIDSDHPRIQEYARRTIGESSDRVERAVKLYLAVRDGIRYNPYSPFHLPEHYQASRVLERGQSFCVPKVSLLCALGRVCGIPSRVGFATVKNHLATKQLIDFLGSNGREDSLFHPFNRDNDKYMEYVEYHGIYADIPIDAILTAWKKAYGKSRVEGWIEMFRHQENRSVANYESEDVWQG